jgi:hypothetical protein
MTGPLLREFKLGALACRRYLVGRLTGKESDGGVYKLGTADLQSHYYFKAAGAFTEKL